MKYTKLVIIVLSSIILTGCSSLIKNTENQFAEMERINAGLPSQDYYKCRCCEGYHLNGVVCMFDPRNR